MKIDKAQVYGIQRAYSRLDVKSITEENDFYVIEGVATTPTPDRMNDVVDPLGAKFAPEMPLLWQHTSDKPVGITTFQKPSKKDIPYSARLPKVKESGALKDRIEEAIQSIKYRLVTGVSIGFRVLNDAYEFLENGGIHFNETEILELSLVTIPANAEATITSIKALDEQQRLRLLEKLLGKSIDMNLQAASGHDVQANVVKQHPSAGASAKKSKPVKLTEGKKMKLTYREQIEALENTRAAKAARQDAIMKAVMDEGRATDDAEGEEFDTLEQEIAAIDKDLKRLQSMEKRAVENAKEPEDKSKGVGPVIIVRNNKDVEEKFQGQNYTRMVIAKALAYLTHTSPIGVAEARWGKSNPTLVEIIKADVAGGGSGSGEWGAELVSADNRYTGDFISFLNSRTIYNQLPLREVPANVTIKGQDGAATGFWVGESKAIPVSAQDYSAVSLTPLKVAALAVVSNELLRDSSPAAEQLVRDALVEAAAQRADSTFLSTTAASAGVSPAGLLNGVTAKNSAGDDADSVLVDIKNLYAPFITAKNATGLWFAMNPSMAKAISLMRNSLGQKEFPDMKMIGGMLEGDNVVTGENVNGSYLILLKPSDIYKIGQGSLEVSISRDATIEMNDAPAGASDTPVDMSAKRVSMFQSESTAIKVVQSMNFAKRRSHAVQYINDANYGAPAT